MGRRHGAVHGAARLDHRQHRRAVDGGESGPLSLKAVVASYILSLAVCIPVSGWIADRYGTRRVFAIAIAVFTISSVFCGLAMNLPQMVAARIL